MQRLLTLAELCDVTGLYPLTLRNWIAWGIVEPFKWGGKGQGNGHRFSISQAVAIAAVVRYRDEGASLDRALGVMHLVASIGVEQLKEDIAAGFSFPVPSMLMGPTNAPKGWVMGMMVNPPPRESLSESAYNLLERIELGAIIRDTEMKIQALDRQARKTPSTKRARPSKGTRQTVG